MTDNILYLLVNVGCISIPLIASFHAKTPFYKEWRHTVPAIFITAALFIIWDIYFIHLGVWRFNPRYILGMYIVNLPLEEVAFFIAIPYACLFVFYCMTRFKKPKSNKAINTLTLIIAAAAALTAFDQYKLIYTSSTLLLVSILLIIFFTYGRSHLTNFWVAFALSLIPFVFANGLLTGSWIREPVVIYNDSYNLKVRLMTIPVEDIGYGMAFQLLNAILFVFFRSGHIASKIRMRNKFVSQK